MLTTQGGGRGGHPTFTPNVIYIMAAGGVLFAEQDGFGLGLDALRRSRR